MNYILGADISVWQDDDSTAQGVDFAKFKQPLNNQPPLSFVYIKSSQANWTDEDHARNWGAAKQAGVPRGAYHFLTWDVSPVVQARYFVSLLQNDNGELPPVVDFEWWKQTPSDAMTKIRAFIIELMANMSGIKPMIYTAPGFWNQYGSTDSWWSQFPLWIAHYTTAALPAIPKPWTEFALWQYTSKGPGRDYGTESGGIDLNRMTEKTAAAWLNRPVELTDKQKLDILWAEYKGDLK